MKQKGITVAELRLVREAGFTFKEIEAMSGVPWSTIRSRCRSLGIKPKVFVARTYNSTPRKHDYPRWLIHMLYWECELSTNDIAYELEMKDSSVTAMMNRMNIPHRSRSEAASLAAKKYPDLRRPPASSEQARKASQVRWENQRKREARTHACVRGDK